MSLAPVFLAVVGAVLQFDSRDTKCDGGFPSLLHQSDFELYLLVEFVGAVLAGVFMVRAATTFLNLISLSLTDSGCLWCCGPYSSSLREIVTMLPSTANISSPDTLHTTIRSA